jgi:hypothetical protein
MHTNPSPNIKRVVMFRSRIVFEFVGDDDDLSALVLKDINWAIEDGRVKVEYSRWCAGQWSYFDLLGSTKGAVSRVARLLIVRLQVNNAKVTCPKNIP